MLPGAVVKAFEAAIRSTTARTGSSASPPAASYAAAVSQPDLVALAGSEEWTGGPVLADPAVWTLPAGGRTPVTAGPPRRPELCLCQCVDGPMDNSIAATERAWDARVAHLLTKLPVRLRSAVEWLREPSRRWLRMGAAVLLMLGGFLSVLPVFGLWMLPLGLALMSDDIPWLKVPLEKLSRGIERLWARVRGGRTAG